MSILMNFTEFKEAVISSLSERMGGNYRVFSNPVKKNNGIELTGVVIEEKGCNTSPTIYIDDFYQDYKEGASLKRITEAIHKIYEENRFPESLSLTDFTDFQKAKSRIAFKLVNYEKNKKLLAEVPSRSFHDLAVVFYFSMLKAPFFGKAAILIHNSHLEKWGVSQDEVYENAMKNTPVLFPPRIENIEDVVADMIKSCEEEEANGCGVFNKEREKISMYVLSNEQKLQGAACLLYPGVLKKFAQRKNSDLFVLPSSIHEVILVPASNQIMGDTLLEIVTDINRTQVEESEVLADSVYYYRRKTDSLDKLF